MVTASSLPFNIKIKNQYWSQAVVEAEGFFLSKEEALNTVRSTLSIEEYDEIQLMFECEDPNAKLYTDVLYGIPDTKEIVMDSLGRKYCKPTEDFFYIFQSDDVYEQLAVDLYLITIVCNETTYYGTLEVRPKQMRMSEWALMKKELEDEVRGLAKELVLKNRGITSDRDNIGVLAPETISKFLILKEHSKQLTAAVMDIVDKPRSQIMTTYDMVPMEKARIFDRETARRYVRTGGSEAVRKVPVKTVTYDIPGNRMLKQMVLAYEKILDEFIVWMENDKNSSIAIEDKQAAYKLRKLSAPLKQKPWYQQVSVHCGHNMPHSFIMDARYNTIYQLYNKLRKNEVQVATKMQYSIAWKQSNILYEIWCFIKVCQMLGQEYTLVKETWDSAFGGQEDCPVLISGTTIQFYNEDVELHVQYDRGLPTNEEDTDENDPLYMVKIQHAKKGHNRPDITILMYSKKHDCYMGSVLIECKYRKYRSFWSESERSSIGQLQTYYNSARSKYLYRDKGNRFNCNPVHQMIVLSPDLRGNTVENKDFNIMIKSIKPSHEDHMFEEVKQVLLDNVEQAVESCDFFLGNER